MWIENRYFLSPFLNLFAWPVDDDEKSIIVVSEVLQFPNEIENC